MRDAADAYDQAWKSRAELRNLATRGCPASYHGNGDADRSSLSGYLFLALVARRAAKEWIRSEIVFRILGGDLH